MSKLEGLFGITVGESSKVSHAKMRIKRGV